MDTPNANEASNKLKDALQILQGDSLFLMSQLTSVSDEEEAVHQQLNAQVKILRDRAKEFQTIRNEIVESKLRLLEVTREQTSFLNDLIQEAKETNESIVSTCTSIEDANRAARQYRERVLTTTAKAASPVTTSSMWTRSYQYQVPFQSEEKNDTPPSFSNQSGTSKPFTYTSSAKPPPPVAAANKGMLESTRRVFGGQIPERQKQPVERDEGGHSDPLSSLHQMELNVENAEENAKREEKKFQNIKNEASELQRDYQTAEKFLMGCQETLGKEKSKKFNLDVRKLSQMKKKVKETEKSVHDLKDSYWKLKDQEVEAQRAVNDAKEEAKKAKEELHKARMRLEGGDSGIPPKTNRDGQTSFNDGSYRIFPSNMYHQNQVSPPGPVPPPTLSTDTGGNIGNDNSATVA